MRKLLPFALSLFLIVGLFFFGCQKKTPATSTTAPQNCNYTQWTGPSNCATSGYYAVSNTKCCPAGYPFSDAGSGKCYATCEEAVSALGNVAIYRYNDGSTTGGSTTGGSTTGGTTTGGTTTGGSCPSMASYVSVVGIVKNTCGNTNDLKITIKNNSTQRLAVDIALKRVDGTWDCGIATPQAGATDSYYICKSTGEYKIRALVYTDWINNCTFGTCP